LASKDRQPDIQLVDEGYMEIDPLLDSQNRVIDLVGQVPTSKSWQDHVFLYLMSKNVSPISCG